MLAVAWAFDFGAAEVQLRFVEAFRLPSGSMAPTLLTGDFIFVDNRPPVHARISHGSIVTYRRSGDSTKYIKRVVGMPGDTLAMRSDTLFRNDRTVDEPYADLSEPVPSEPVASDAIRNWGPFTVPDDHVFILGDNRHSSLDSRHVGPIPLSGVLGTVRFIYYSYDSESDRALAAITAVRWERLGQVPR